MKNLSVILLVCFYGFFCKAQDGDFFVTTYIPQLPNIDHLYFDMDFSSRDELVVANKAGVIKFDGLEWDFYSTPSSATSLAIGENNDIYVGCTGDFGYIGLIDGEFTFQSLAADSTLGIVKQTLISNGSVFYLTDDLIAVYDLESKSINSFGTYSDSSYFELIFEFNGEIYVQGDDRLYQFNGNLEDSPPLLPDEESVQITSRNPYNGDYLFISSENNAYAYSENFRKRNIPDSILITDLSWVSETTIGISTYSSGILFFDIKSNRITGSINGGEGLPDNEIFSIIADHEEGLWVANSFGFARVAPNLPIRSFNYYPGLEGNILSVLDDGNNRYIGTSNGLYYFDEEKKYKNVVYYVPKKRVTSYRTPERTKEVQEKAKTRKKTFSLKNTLSKSRGKKVLSLGNNKTASTGTKKKKLNISLNTSGLINKISKNQKVRYERRTRRELVSTSYLYRAVDGLNEKCKSLISFGDRYIALTSSGISEIKDNAANEISDEPVRFIYNPPSTNQLMISTMDGNVNVLELEDDLWLESSSIEIPGDLIITIYKDSKERIWAAGATNLYNLVLDDEEGYIESFYPLKNQFFDDIRITEINDKIYLINNQGYFVLDEDKGSLEESFELMDKVGLAKKHLIQSNGQVWVNNGTNWYRIENDESVKVFTYLKLFPEMTFIDQINDELWLVDNNDLLYKYTPNEDDSLRSGNMFYKEIRAKKGILDSKSTSLSFDYQNNSFHFEMARPDYLGLLNVEYQYLLSGQSEQWSNWTKNNHIDLTYLPAGNYTLQVRSRDTFGREQESEPIKISVSPPYWQTTWFNAMEVAFFAILVFGSAILNRRTHEKYALITGLLTIVTVVMIIEFLQNAAGSLFGEMGTPVIAFGIDVVVALFVFPLELFLKKFVQGKPKPAVAKSEV